MRKNYEKKNAHIDFIKYSVWGLVESRLICFARGIFFQIQKDVEAIQSLVQTFNIDLMEQYMTCNVIDLCLPSME